MKLVWSLLSLGFLPVAFLWAQGNPNVSAFPTSVADDTVLFVASNRASTTLSVTITSSDTSITVASSAAFNTPTFLTIDNERIKACSKVGNVFTVCGGGRGADGSSAASHSSGARVDAFVVAWTNNQPNAEIKSIESELGAGMSKVAVLARANTFTSGFRQSVGHNATTPGFRLVPAAGDPSTLLDGDSWYDSTAGKFRCRQAGVSIDCAGGGGGGAPTGASYLVLSLDASLTAERQFVDGAGLAATDGGANGSYTLATASGETGFLASGALLCGAGTAGRAQVHTTPLQYCDNAITPALRYSAYATALGEATAINLTANPANCSGNNFALGIDSIGAGECAQPAFSNLSGSATKTQLPAAVAYEDEANVFTVAGGLTMDAQLGLRLREAAINGTEFIEHRATASIVTSSTYTWPVAAAGFLRSDSSGGLTWNAASGTGACGANTFASTLNDNAAPTCTQPAFSNLSGTATKTQLPATVAYEDEVNIFTLAGGVTLDNALALRLRELTVNGTNFWALKAPDLVTADFTWTAPDGNPASTRCIEITSTGQLQYAAAACGTGGSGDNISVNGVAATDADFDDATPAAPGDGVNVRWQKDALTPNNVSANLQFATGSLAGAVSITTQTIAGAKTYTGAGKYSEVTLTQEDNAIGTTSTDGVILQNTTAAAAGAQQMSPRTRWTGQGWKTAVTAASQTVDFIVEVLPVEGVANPASQWRLASQINAGGYTNRLVITDKGVVDIRGSNPTFEPKLFITSAGADYPYIATRSSQGTLGAPTATVNGDPIGGWLTYGYDGAAFQIGSLWEVDAVGTWSGTNRATTMSFNITATASTDRQAMIFLEDNKFMRLGWRANQNGVGAGQGNFTVGVRDGTATTGVTRLTVEAAEGQSTNPLTVWQSSAAAAKLSLIASGGEFEFNSGATQAQGLLMDMAQPGVAGQRDSHWIEWTGTSFDTVGHDADWRCFADVTSNAAASTFTCQSRIDAGAFTTRFAVSDAGVITTGSAAWETLTNVSNASTNYISDDPVEKFNVLFRSNFTSGNQFKVGQDTGNPTGGNVFVVAVDDPDPVVSLFWRPVDGATILIDIQNSQANAAASINETADLRATFGSASAPGIEAGRISFGKTEDYTVAANESSFIAFLTRTDGTTAEAGRFLLNGVLDVVTGFRIGGGATTGRYLRGNGTNFVVSAGAASGTGTCTNQFPRTLNDDAAPTCATIAKADLPAAVAYEDEANIFTLAGGLTMDNALALRLRELTANGVNFWALKAPNLVTADFTWTAPDGNPASTRCLEITSAGQLQYAAGVCGTPSGATWEGLTNSADTATAYLSNTTTETVDFQFQAAFTTGSQFAIRQNTGNPTGGTLFEVRAADVDVVAMRVGDGTNGLTVTQAGATKVGEATLTQEDNAIGVTSTDGIIVQNTTAAAAGAQQMSPRIHASGRGWKTDVTAASQAVDLIQEILPLEGASSPGFDYRFRASVNAGAYGDILILRQAIDGGIKQVGINGAPASGRELTVSGDAQIGGLLIGEPVSKILGSNGNGGSILLQDVVSQSYTLESYLATTATPVFILNSRPSGGTEDLFDFRKSGTSIWKFVNSGAVNNGTYDAEATGNVLTIPVLVEWVAAICQNATASLGVSTFTSNQPTAVCVTGTNTTYGVAQFPDTDGDFQLQYRILLPDDWTGNIDVELFWRVNATTGDAVWQIQSSCVADAETGDPAWDVDVLAITDTSKGTANQFNEATGTLLTSSHLSGCAAGEYLFQKLYRNRTHASDTLGAVTPELISWRYKMRRAM